MMKGKIARCPDCGSEDVEYYDRITGYIQQLGHRKGSIGGWNQGKLQEFNDRRRHNLNGGIL
jgi:ribonucleoside-triphosphate reductase